MSEQVVEYLYFSKTETPENISDILSETLSPYTIDSKSILIQENKNLTINFIISTYNNSLHVIFKYKKSSQISLQEVSIFQDFLKKINLELNKKKIKHTTLLNTNSLFLSKKLVPYLHKYEWSIRKLIYLIIPEHFSENWTINSVSKEKQNDIKSKLKGQYPKENLLQEFDLNDFEVYLFNKNYIDITENNKTTSINFTELEYTEFLSLFHEQKISLSKPYSLWEEVFNDYINVELEEIQPDMSKIRSARNIVTHNKELSVDAYKDVLIKLKKYIRYLDIAFSKILNGDIDDEPINNMVQDLEKVILNDKNMTLSRSFQPVLDSIKSTQEMTSKMALSRSFQPVLDSIKSTQEMTSKIALSSSFQPILDSIKSTQEMTSKIALSRSFQPILDSIKSTQEMLSNMALSQSFGLTLDTEKSKKTPFFKQK